MVQTQTTVLPGAADAAVLRLRDSGGKGLALTADCNPRYCYLDPYEGARLAVAEAARNLSCVGATPLAVTDCLNFASPGKAGRLLAVPAGGRGSGRRLRGVRHSGHIGQCVVLQRDARRGHPPYPDGPAWWACCRMRTSSVTQGFQKRGRPDYIYLLGGGKPTLGGSEYLALIHGQEVGKPPSLDMDAEKKLQAFLRDAISQGLLQSAHDVSDGGLAV